MLLELALLSVAYYYAFGDHRITPSPAPAAVRALLTDQRGASHLRASISGVREVETLVYSLRTFLYDVFSFTDILQISYFHVEGGDDVGLSEPLTSMLDGKSISIVGNSVGGACIVHQKLASSMWVDLVFYNSDLLEFLLRTSLIFFRPALFRPAPVAAQPSSAGQRDRGR